MRIPKTIDIFGTTYTTMYKWNLTDEGEKCDGICDTAKKIIWLDRLCTTDEKKYAFFHECFHAALAETGMSTTALGRHEDVEELIVENLSKWILDHFNLRKKPKR